MKHLAKILEDMRSYDYETRLLGELHFFEYRKSELKEIIDTHKECESCVILLCSIELIEAQYNSYDAAYKALRDRIQAEGFLTEVQN